jgi:hypothetical protein
LKSYQLSAISSQPKPGASVFGENIRFRLEVGLEFHFKVCNRCLAES